MLLKLLSMGNANAKLKKNDKYGNYLSAILYLAPHNVAGYQVCPFASNGCKKGCVYTAGRGCFSNVQQARIRRKKLFFENPEVFNQHLIEDINKLLTKSNKLGKQLVIRLNGTSDIDWRKVKIAGKYNVFQLFPNVTFYDYTKNYSMLAKNRTKNLHLTFSNTETNDSAIIKALNCKKKCSSSI